MSERQSATATAAGMMGGAVERVEETVQQFPFSSVLTAFGIGLGLGVVLGCALAEPQRPSHWYDNLSAERFGRSMLDSLSNVLPEKFARHVS